MRKIFLLVSIFFIYNCNFTPLYLTNNKDILINLKDIKGDFELNNYIRNELKIVSNKNSKNIFEINVETKYEKIILTKDATGKATDYKVNFSSKFMIISEQNKILSYKESFKIKNSDKKFEQANYEKEIKKNFAKIIKDNLIFDLINLDDN